MKALILFFLAITKYVPPRDSEDAEVSRLVELVRGGQADAFEEIVFRYREPVYAAAWNLTRNTEDALDVTQEAFIRAYNAISSYKGHSRFGTWLHRIVLNTGIDFIRREARHRHGPTDESADDDKPSKKTKTVTAATQRETVYAEELHRQLLTALEALSTRQRQVFLLRYFHGMDSKEIAEIIKCTQGSVKRHLFRAQTRLRELLSDLRMSDDKR